MDAIRWRHGGQMEPSDGNENIERFMVGVGYSET